MKRVLFILVIIFLGGENIAAQTMNWTLVNTGTTKNIRDISFMNRDTGFIAGDDGLFKMTTNGGLTWTDLSLPSTGQGTGNNNNIKVAQFADYGSGMISGVLFFDKFTAINRTYNLLVDGWLEECGGSMFMDDSVCSINNFDRANAFTEYAAGGSCENPGGIAGWFGGFCFNFDTVRTDTSFGGWADVTSNANDEVIFVGEDGYVAKYAGFNYTILNSGNGKDYLSVDWSDTSTLYAAVDDEFLELEKSTDGGNTWSTDSTVGFTFYYPVINELDFTDNDWGVMAAASNGSMGVIITKRGNNWVDYFSTDSIMTSVWVMDSTLAFVGGLGGEMYKYEQTGGVGIENVSENIDFNIFPNPQNVNSTELNLLVAEEVREISIYDMMGKLILNEKPNKQGNIQLNTGIQNSGTYLIRIFTDKGVGTKKYIVN